MLKFAPTHTGHSVHTEDGRLLATINTKIITEEKGKEVSTPIKDFTFEFTGRLVCKSELEALLKDLPPA